jgi:hypothetical protein
MVLELSQFELVYLLVVVMGSHPISSLVDPRESGGWRREKVLSDDVLDSFRMQSTRKHLDTGQGRPGPGFTRLIGMALSR